MIQPGGLVESLRTAASALVETVQTRLSLFGNELEEHGARFARVAMLFAVGGFCAAIAIVLAAMFLVVLFWDSHPLLVLGMLTALFGAAALAAIVAAKTVLSARPRPFADTLAELERDRDALARMARKA
jgi:uncharacterized membrane protein YqjE